MTSYLRISDKKDNMVAVSSLPGYGEVLLTVADAAGATLSALTPTQAREVSGALVKAGFEIDDKSFPFGTTGPFASPTFGPTKKTIANVGPFPAKARPHGPQEYKGNGKHEWENVTPITFRLRVPGGWLYSQENFDGPRTTTFVPMPKVVGYDI